ncbi:MAG: hypothetical protein COB35_14145 [Gammaproteobacteria bacterium]|nr:MAG: hypothetical protein COB35_14145 [Gammaproteobacteria bacterium]
MSKNEQKHNIQEYFSALFELLGQEYNWQWEERRSAWLAEFSRDKVASTLAILEQHFDDAWHPKNIKKAPKELQVQLADLAKLAKEQKLFTTPANLNKPTLLAVWWPWGHGATVSLRLMTLENTYVAPAEFQTKDNFFTVIKKLFAKS